MSDLELSWEDKEYFFEVLNRIAVALEGIHESLKTAHEEDTSPEREL